MRKVLVGIADNYAPDVQAMMMAKYSRSYESIEDRLPDTKESEDQHRQSLFKYYVGYGHKSVSQLGGTTIWLEGVSQLAAKAIENHPLFNGQESSTRYIDFSTQPMISNHPEITEWQEKFRAFYIKAIPLVTEKIKAEYPFETNQGNYHHKEDVAVQEAKMRTTWENTVKARAFDICGGILPAGCTTNVAFSGTFDTINDHFGEMLMHPCFEMTEIAKTVLDNLKEKYQYASVPLEQHYKRNSYIKNDFFYFDIEKIDKPFITCFLVVQDMEITTNVRTREKFEKIPRFISDKVRVTLAGDLDFRSYRDIHRHRNGCINMEVLTPNKGFHDFYINELPTSLQIELQELLISYKNWYTASEKLSEFDKQYCTPMGYQVTIVYTCDLNQMIYIMELRSGKTVHQTLRKLVHSWVNDFNYKASKLGIKIHADMDENNFTLRRGTQTFNESILNE